MLCLEPQGQPFINGCFNWMIPNLYIGNGWKSPNIHFLMVGLGVPGIIYIKVSVSVSRFLARPKTETFRSESYYTHSTYGCWTKNRGGKSPKMDGENHGSKPYEQMDDLGVPLFLGWHPYPFQKKTLLSRWFSKFPFQRDMDQSFPQEKHHPKLTFCPLKRQPTINFQGRAVSFSRVVVIEIHCFGFMLLRRSSWSSSHWTTVG